MTVKERGRRWHRERGSEDTQTVIHRERNRKRNWQRKRQRQRKSYATEQAALTGYLTGLIEIR